MTLRLAADDPLVRQLLSPSEMRKLPRKTAKHLGVDEPTAEDHIAQTFKRFGLHHDMVRQHRFHPERQWRFDFAWPLYMLAVEYHGLVIQRVRGEARVRGGHATLSGMRGDMDKFNAAQMRGWTVLVCEQDAVKRGSIFELVELALSGRQYFVRNDRYQTGECSCT